MSAERSRRCYSRQEKDIIVSSLDPGWVRTEMSPQAPTDVKAVVPRVLELATLPEGAPSGIKWQV